ncbi:uncharacterized protein LOC111283527 [Durio zibethinus]|uniref:Uncharacterized protein LOC111283527 n=1 Tax=Durio zibethinus TaxID=66656 RepID=A0A6P5XJ77_DURZI|nr:uncharacterized protein LOC111283527 [Durio zibethinus]
MTTRKRRESIQRVIVVLQGEKVATENTGIAPLWRASKYVTNTEDEILVLTLLSWDGSGPSSSKGFHGEHRCNYASEEDPYIRFLRQEISQRKEDYRRICRPFYERCKSNGVKFLVKIAVGFQPKDIISEEANNVGATWIIIDSSIARHLTFWLNGIECNVSLVSDEEEALVHDHLLAKDEIESSMLMEVTHNRKSPKLMKGSISKEEQSICHWPSTSGEIEQETICEPLIENKTPGLVEPTGTSDVPYSYFSARVSEVDFMVERPKQLSWEVPVFVKELAAYSRGILEAEMRAALSMYHKNIMVLTGPERRELKFQARLKIAIGIAQGVRYMHEECRQGPVVHGELQPRNIFLRPDLQPMISGFGKARWLHYEQVSSNSKNMYFLMDPLGHESMAMVKSDVLSFGVLLLRLFCRTSAPEDDKSIIEWARPLMVKRKFHELLEEDSDFSDMHGIYRVMAAATACTRTEPISRPHMAQVIRLLKGEQLCDMQCWE